MATGKVSERIALQFFHTDLALAVALAETPDGGSQGLTEAQEVRQAGRRDRDRGGIAEAEDLPARAFYSQVAIGATGGE